MFRRTVFSTTNLLFGKDFNQISLHSEFNQLYFDFVYSDYFNKYSEFKYLLDLINQIDWSGVPEFNNPISLLFFAISEVGKKYFMFFSLSSFGSDILSINKPH